MASKGKRRDSDGQYVNSPHALLKSKAWRSLSGAAIKVWFELHTRFNGGNNGKLHLSMNEAAKLLHISKSTAQRAFAELEEKGFIVLQTPGSWYGGRAHEWRLTTKRMNTTKGAQLATNDWRYWREKTEVDPPENPSPKAMGSNRYPSPATGITREPVKARFSNGPGTNLGH
jgi:DNA-binding transcriptional MocR family regulator